MHRGQMNLFAPSETLKVGDMVRNGGMPTAVVESANAEANIVVLVRADLHRSFTQYNRVVRVFPGADTRNLYFGPVTHPLWATARARYLGPICPDCGAAGAAIDDNGQGDYRCDDCTGEWRTDGKKVAL